MFRCLVRRAAERRHGHPERKRNGQGRSIAGAPRRGWTNILSKKCVQRRRNVSAVAGKSTWWMAMGHPSCCSATSTCAVTARSRRQRHRADAQKKEPRQGRGAMTARGKTLNFASREGAAPAPPPGRQWGGTFAPQPALQANAGTRLQSGRDWVRPAFRGRIKPSGPSSEPVLRCLFFLSRARSPALPGLQPSSRHACGCAKSVNAGVITARDRA